MKLCLVAGQGRLPQIVADAVGPALVSSVEGVLPDGLSADLAFRIERLGSFRDTLRDRGITHICLAGAIQRPNLDLTRVDTATAPLVPRMAAVMGQGDDAALRLVLSLFNEVGITPLGAHDLVPDLLPPPGVLAGDLPPSAYADATRAAAIVAAMGQADVGQSCIVAGGQALAIEALPGTDRMIHGLAMLRAENDDLPAGGVLFKAPKPGQDRRVDLPAIGPETVRRAAGAGLQGVVIEAGGVLLLDAEVALETARAGDLFLWVRGA